MAPFDEQTLSPWLPELSRAPSLLVGFSGGLDSTVLLHALCRLLPPHKIHALHVNHGLSPNAAAWQAHCERACHSLGVRLKVEKVVVAAAGKGLEEAAREQRYRAFARHLGDGGLLLLAHHRDDQVETVLFRLLRGSGPRGLAGMPVRRPLGRGELLRPLLATGREALGAWASAEGLDWIDDESNAGTAFDRNFLRHQVLPPLVARWPDLDRRILRSAGDCGDSDQLLREVGAEDLLRLGERSERLGWSIPVAGLCELSPRRRANLLRTWVARHGLPLPGHRQLAAVLDDLLPARDDAAPLVRFGGGEFRRHGGRLFLLPGHLPPVVDNADEEGCARSLLRDRPPTASAADTSPHRLASLQERPPAEGAVPLRWRPDDPLALPDGFTLAATVTSGGGLRATPGGEFEVRFRRGGERCKPAGRAGSRPLKKLLQEYGLEPWLRDRIPLVFVDGELAAVGDLFVCAGFEAGAGEPGFTLSWEQ